MRLSPLYDFAPMFLNADLIRRSSVWGPGYEVSCRVDWCAVLRDLRKRHRLDPLPLLPFLDGLDSLPARLASEKLSVEVETHCLGEWQKQQAELRRCRDWVATGAAE